MRILIIEDDPALGLFLTKGLQLEGHDVFLAADGESGLNHALAHVPDLMVLDLGLPRKDGVQVLEQMHGRFAETSVLVLTGRSSVEDRVKCLNLGADDCLLKPFSLSELMARCRALIRRRAQYADPILRVGDLELNRMERSVKRDGHAVELTSKEFALLEYLMQARGKPASARNCCGRSGRRLHRQGRMSWMSTSTMCAKSFPPRACGTSTECARRTTSSRLFAGPGTR